jgi:hypothetical protein
MRTGREFRLADPRLDNMGFLMGGARPGENRIGPAGEDRGGQERQKAPAGVHGLKVLSALRHDPQIAAERCESPIRLAPFAILLSGALPEKVRDGARSPLSLGGYA